MQGKPNLEQRQGGGHSLLPPLKGGLSTETRTGKMEFRRE